MKKRYFVVIGIESEDEGTEEVKVWLDDLKKLVYAAIEEGGKEEIPVEVHGKSGAKTILIDTGYAKKIIKYTELLNSGLPKEVKAFLEDYTLNLVEASISPITGRDNEIEKAWFYLSQKDRNNVFFVGEADVGKSAIAKELIRQISTNECPKEFFEKQVYSIRYEEILETRFKSKIKRRINAILNFLKENSENAILYIDDMSEVVEDENLISILENCIKKYNIPVIANARIDDFENYIITDLSIAKYINCIDVEEPELEEIAPMIKKHIEVLEEQYGIKISEENLKFGIFTSSLTNSVSSNPGNVVNVFERAFLEAKRKGKEEVDKPSILSCYDSYLKLYNNTTEEEKRMIAYHETGHYVVSRMCKNIKDQNIAFVSILPMMDFLGVNQAYKKLGKTLNYTRDYFLDQIAICMGGRIAEKLFTSKDSSGASSDLAQANAVAENMLIVYGLSNDESQRNRSYINTEYQVKTYLISEERKQKMDKEIQELINNGYRIAEEIIKENIKLIEIIAEALLKEEILTGEQLNEFVESYKASK